MQRPPMTFGEFKAWLEGFEASFTGDYLPGAPNAQQWAQIRAQLGRVPEPVTPQLDPGFLRPVPEIWQEPLRIREILAPEAEAMGLKACD